MQQRFRLVKKTRHDKGVGFARSSLLSLSPSLSPLLPRARHALLLFLLLPPLVAAFAILVTNPHAIYKCQAFACTCSTLYDLCIPIVREREAGHDRGGPSSQQSRRKNLIGLKSSILATLIGRDKISRCLPISNDEFLLFERTLRERLSYVSDINRTFVQHATLKTRHRLY